MATFSLKKLVDLKRSIDRFSSPQYLPTGPICSTFSVIKFVKLLKFTSGSGILLQNKHFEYRTKPFSQFVSAIFGEVSWQSGVHMSHGFIKSVLKFWHGVCKNTTWKLEFCVNWELRQMNEKSSWKRETTWLWICDRSYICQGLLVTIYYLAQTQNVYFVQVTTSLLGKWVWSHFKVSKKGANVLRAHLWAILDRQKLLLERNRLHVLFHIIIFSDFKWFSIKSFKTIRSNFFIEVIIVLSRIILKRVLSFVSTYYFKNKLP